MKELKAGVYCRVSTTKDSQEESIEQQEINGIKTCKEMGFELVACYKEKKTATEAEARTEYQRMLHDIISERINVIVVKDILRLNRNNLDWHMLLKTIHVSDCKMYFYLDRQFYEDDRELEYNVRQMFGAAFSKDLSKKARKAHKERQESGRSVILTNNVWGYKNITDEQGKKKLVLDDDEVEMIHLIFQYCIEGYGCSSIAKMLYEKGYRNHNGKIFGSSVIDSIIRNSKVTGTVAMNKRNRDFYTKKYVPTAENEWIIKDGMVPIIIDIETWQKANQAMDSRRRNTCKNKGIVAVGRYEGKKLLSKKLFCGLCGSKFYVNSRYTANEKVYDWLCSTSRTHRRKTVNEFKPGNCNQIVNTGQGCDNIRLKESDIVEILNNVAQDYFDFKNEQNILDKALRILRDVFIEGDGTRKMQEEKETEEKRLVILESREKQATYKLLDGVMKDEMYKQVTSEIARERQFIQNRLESLTSKAEEVRNIENRLIDIEKALKEGLLTQATSYSVLEWSEKLLVYPDRLDIHLDMEKMLGSTLTKSIEGQDKIISVSLEKYKMRYCESGMKKTNDAILKIISENPKVTRKELSEKVGLSVATVYSRLKEMKEKGILSCSGNGRAKIWKVENQIIIS